MEMDDKTSLRNTASLFKFSHKLLIKHLMAGIKDSSSGVNVTYVHVLLYIEMAMTKQSKKISNGYHPVSLSGRYFVYVHDCALIETQLQIQTA